MSKSRIVGSVAVLAVLIVGAAASAFVVLARKALPR